MEFNEYTASWMVKARHAELVAAARRQALAREARGPRRPMRITVGTALIRTGAWLLRDHYGASEATG